VESRGELLDAILDHPAVRRFGVSVEERAQGVLDTLADSVERAARRAFDKPARQRPEYQGPDRAFRSECPPRPAGDPRRSQSPPPRRGAPAEDPRTVLGFPPSAKLTRQDVKKRRRELARIFHGDAGGYDDAMKRVNLAADALLAHLP